MEKIIIYGKGGIGKSFIAANLSLTYARQGYRVLHIGCDPKHDSSISLLNGNKINTVINLMKTKSRQSLKAKDFIVRGLGGIDCIEAGGPEPGVGCAGYGISIMFEILTDLHILNEKNYDIVIYDVLGDIVCGGFAAPLKLNFGKKIIIVVSEEAMSLYAANNICKAVKKYEDNGVFLCGLILNKKDNTVSSEHLNSFTKLINTTLLGRIPRSKFVTFSEYKKKPVIEAFPESKFIKLFAQLGQRILSYDESKAKKVRPVPQLF